MGDQADRNIGTVIRADYQMTIDEFLKDKQFTFRKTAIQINLDADNLDKQEMLFNIIYDNRTENAILKNGMTIDELIPFSLNLNGVKTFRYNRGFCIIILDNGIAYINYNDETIMELLNLTRQK